MGDIVKLVAKRLGLGLITLLVVSILIFFAVELLPGDIAQAVLGQGATEETVAALRERMGLNDPWFVRYFQWLGGALTLLFCELAGRAIADWLPVPMPGAVIGMLLLLAGLILYGQMPRGLASVGSQLLRILVLILLPPSVGVFFLHDLPLSDWLIVTAAMLIGTLVSLALTALLLHYLIRRVGATGASDNA